MRTFDLQVLSNQKLKLTFGKLALSAMLLSCGPSIFAQNVGINTQQPDPSSALDIVGTDKGLLIPRVSLQSLADNVTIPNPATALLVYNTNAGLGKIGFYYNSGTAAAPAWSRVGGDASLTLPFSQLGTNNGPLFLINNNDGNGTSVGISGLAANAIGVRGATLSGKGVVGHAGSTGIGVFASATDTDGKALEVSGPMKIGGPGQSPGNGKVLMSDGSGNATWENITGDVAFRASGILGGGNEVIAGNGVPIKVAFANQNYDRGDDYNDVNGSPHSTFVAPVNGLYHFETQSFFVGSTYGGSEYENFDRTLSLMLTRNGGLSTITKSGQMTRLPSYLSLSVDVELQQGDQVHVTATLDTPKIDGPKSDKLSTSSVDASFSGRLLFRK
ncbi:hypothetical protein [Dyadobacter sp. CY347]|uniref:hypothetical protein n=1 Tax=Dyadobacter sp. CY347 TaxID=2909336 RepID=UPI001F3935C6|nr:hypothetical protein [Dyadobacter sp. CY347]MCF2491183.1 hypothetical protein [Dyadobacter sp. CY347]